MRRLITILATFTPLLAVDLLATRSYAQGWGVAMGVYSGAPYRGPAVGFYPLYYHGFYGNGTSMYGPPVPTYGPVPGTFGGSDVRVRNNAPFFGLTLGWKGYRSPSPRPVPNFSTTPPADYLDSAEPPLLPAPSPVSIPANRGVLIVEVRLPDERAAVYIDGKNTIQSGPVRLFSSPALPAGEMFEYEVRVEWIDNGQKISRTQRVEGKAGDHVVANFSR